MDAAKPKFPEDSFNFGEVQLGHSIYSIYKVIQL